MLDFLKDIKLCTMISLLALVVAVFMLYRNMITEGFRDSTCPDWHSRSGMIQVDQCCTCNDDCLGRYKCINGKCQRPMGDRNDCRSLGWDTSYDGVCVD